MSETTVSTTRPLLTLKHVVLVLLILCNVLAWWTVHYKDTLPAELRVSVLDIGQGDAIFIDGPTGIQLLIDGGPDRSVLRRLPQQMSLLDRTIDLVVETHPDMDHIAGLSYVFDRYGVANFISPGVENEESSFVQSLQQALADERGVEEFIARRGMRIHLGDGAYADVLYPDHDVSREETNEGSIILKVVYGKTSFMLTGDASSEIESKLIAHARADDGDATELQSTVLKAGHHGSKYSTSAEWLAAVHPAFVVISAGKENRYGHPAPEVLDRTQRAGATVVSTIEQGTIEFVSDGETIWLES